MDIGTPYNTIHVTHVGFDPATGEFTGLPREWQVLLNQSGITSSEQRQNPQVNTHINSSLYLYFNSSFPSQLGCHCCNRVLQSRKPATRCSMEKDSSLQTTNYLIFSIFFFTFCDITSFLCYSSTTSLFKQQCYKLYSRICFCNTIFLFRYAT